MIVGGRLGIDACVDQDDWNLRPVRLDDRRCDLARAAGGHDQHLDAGLEQVLDDLHLLLDVDLALGRLDDQLQARAIGCLLRPSLHVEKERVVECLHDERHARRPGGRGRGVAIARDRPRQDGSRSSLARRCVPWIPPVLRSAPLEPHVDENGHDDNGANHHLLKKRRHVQEIESVAEHSHDQRADERAEQGPFPAEQAGPADYGRGDRVELVVRAGGRLGRVETRRQDGCRRSAGEAGNAIDDRFVKPDLNPGQSRRFLVAADLGPRPVRTPYARGRSARRGR